MPVFRVVQHFPHPRERLFAFFLHPADVAALAPPALGLRLLEAPPLLSVGARVVAQVRRWGLAARLVSEVVQLQAPELLVEQTRQGPLPRWQHTRRFTAQSPEETELTEEIDYAVPTGLLGLTLTQAVIEQELADAYAHRYPLLLQRLAQP